MTNLPIEAINPDAAKRRAVDYLELTKPRIPADGAGRYCRGLLPRLGRRA